MTNLTIRNGKLYKAVRHVEGLAEYIDSMIDNDTINVIGFNGVAVAPTSIQKGGGSVEIEIAISRTKGCKIADCAFVSEQGGELVDLKTEHLGNCLVTLTDAEGKSGIFTQRGVIPEMIKDDEYGTATSIHYIDVENGETLKVWDDENGYAWEVE